MALVAIPSLALADITKPFHLYVDEARDIAKAVLMSLSPLKPVSLLPDDKPTKPAHECLKVTYLIQSINFDTTDILLATLDDVLSTDNSNSAQDSIRYAGTALVSQDRTIWE